MSFVQPLIETSPSSKPNGLFPVIRQCYTCEENCRGNILPLSAVRVKTSENDSELHKR